jgi:acyl-CoA synthetase (NDP forming)
VVNSTDRCRLARLLHPRSVAVVGGVFAERVVEQTRKIGFTGNIHAVNPRRETIGAVRCVPRIEDLPEVPDAVFLGISREGTVDAVRRLAAIGAGGAVCYAAGFAEVADGVALERELITAAGEMPLLGPNCYGLINGLDGVALWPDEHGVKRTDTGVALITQSGNIGVTLTMQDRGLDIAYMLSVGNQATLGIPDYIDVLADDKRVRAIGLYVEGIADAPGLAAAALKCAARNIPVIAIKAGRSPAGARAALSHTAALISEDDVVDAFFARYGIARVGSLAELLETLKLVSIVGPLAGNRLASMSCSGGDAAMVADLAESVGLDLAPLPERSRRALVGILGARVAVANPLDYHTYIWADREHMTACFGAVVGAGYDAAILVLDYPRPGENDVSAWDAALDALIDAKTVTGGVTAVVSSLSEALPQHARKRLAEAGVAPLQGLPEGMRAIERAAWLRNAWDRIAASPPPAPTRTGADINGTPVVLSEPAAKFLLSKHGICVPSGQETAIDAAVVAAQAIGYPVALKTATEVAHKTEVGGVALNLMDAGQVAAAAQRMAGLGELVRVEEMLPAPIAELILGANVDPIFGPYLVVGSGGLWVEIHRDRQILLLPTDDGAIRDALHRLKLWPILQGHREAPPADVDAIVEAIRQLAHFVEKYGDRILEIDINPLMVFAGPRGAIAADAFMRLAAPIDDAAATGEQPE